MRWPSEKCAEAKRAINAANKTDESDVAGNDESQVGLKAKVRKLDLENVELKIAALTMRRDVVLQTAERRRTDATIRELEGKVRSMAQQTAQQQLPQHQPSGEAQRCRPRPEEGHRPAPRFPPRTP